MSETKNEVTYTHSGTVIEYDERLNKWTFTLRNRDRQTDSLAEAKAVIDTPVKGKPFERMQRIAHLVDEELPDKWFFVVIAGPMEGQEGRVNYVANGQRENIVTMLKNLLARWEEPGKFQGHFEEEV